MASLEELPAEELATPEQEAPAGDPPLKRLWASLHKREPEFKVDYPTFESDMQDEANLRELHKNLASRYKDFTVPADEFLADMTASKKKAQSASGLSSAPAGSASAISGLAGPSGANSPALTAQDEEAQQLGAFRPAGPLAPQALDEEFQPQPVAAGVPAPAPSLVPAEIPDAEQVPEGASVPVSDIGGPQLVDSSGNQDSVSALSAIQQAPGDEYLAAGLPTPSGEQLRADTEKADLSKLAELPGTTNGDVRPIVDRNAVGEQPAPLGYGRERVVVPKEYDGVLPAGTVTDPQTGLRYFDRALSDKVDGKTQTAGEGAWALFKNSLLEMGQGLVEGAGALDSLVPGGDPVMQAGVFQADQAIEGGKAKVSDLNARQPFDIAHPSTALMKSAEYAPLVFAQVAQTLAPELRAPEAVTAALGLATTVGFDAQMVHNAAEHAKAAGLKGNDAARYTLFEGALVLAGFKGGSKLMGALGDKLATKLAPDALREQVSRDAVARLARFEAQLGRAATPAEQSAVLSQSLRAALPGLAQVPKEMVQQAPTFAGVEALKIAGNQVAAPALGGQADDMTPGQALGQIGQAGGAGALMGLVTGGTSAALGPLGKPGIVPLGVSPGRGPLYAEFGPDRLTVRYLDAKGAEVDFGPAGPPPAVHQAVGAARARVQATAPIASENAQSGAETVSSVPENPETVRATAPGVPEAAAPADVAGPPAPVEPGPATGSVPVGDASTSPAAGTEAAAPEVVPAYGTPAENRSNGRFEKDGATYARQAPLGEKVARGTATTAEFSSGVQQPVQYAVMEAADLQPSHTGGTQNLSHFLPEAQPKNRSAAFDPASQKAIGDIAASPDLGRLGEAPNAYSGAPIVNGRGEALQGNGRGEGIRQHYQQGGESYKRDVVAAAEKVGIPAEKTAGFREPVLVRIADVSDQRARELGNYTAADTESGGKRRLDARQAAGRMNDEDRGTLTRLATPRGDATLTETVRGNTEEILRFLRKAGLVNETQLQTLVKADGTLTPQGVEDIAGLYRHQLFREGDPNLPELFAELPGPAQGGLDRAVGALLGVPESASLVPEVQDAIGGVREFMSSGTDFNTWAGQADMFRGGTAPRERYNPLTLKLIELLATEKRPTYIARLFNEHAAAVKGEAASLFGETPPKPRAEAVKETFGVTDEQRNPSAGNGRGAESPARPVDADQRPAPPELPDAPGADPAGQPAAESAAAPDAAARAGGAAATAGDAGPERGAVVAPKAVAVRVMGGYLASDGTRFTGTGAKARAGAHSEQVGLVGRRIKAYDGSVDVVEGVTPKADGSGYDYTVRGEADGKTRTHGTAPAAADILPSADVTDTNVGDMPVPLRPTQERAAALDAEYVKLQAELVEAKRANPARGQALATLVPLPTITPAEASVYVKMITNRLQKGVVKVADLLADLRASLGPQLGAASDEDLTKVIQYAKDERAEEAAITRAAVLQDLPRRHAELEARLLGSVSEVTTPTGTAVGKYNPMALASRAQEATIGAVSRRIGEAISRVASKATASENRGIRELVYTINAISKGFVQTSEQRARSESFQGQAQDRAPADAQYIYHSLVEGLRDPALPKGQQGEGQRTSLRRIDQILDPAFYRARSREGFEGLLRERLGDADFDSIEAADLDKLYAEHTSLLSTEQLAATGELTEDDLTDQEWHTLQDLKSLYTFVHDSSFGIGRVSFETWINGRDETTGDSTYVARLYDPFELPQDLQGAWAQGGASPNGRREETGLYKQRETLESAFKIANKTEDAVFIATTRLRQALANRAIYDYSQAVKTNDPHLVIVPGRGKNARLAAEQKAQQKGFVYLESGYGELSNTYVARHIFEDFKGAFFTNKTTQSIYEFTQQYNRWGWWGLRPALKKMATVFSLPAHLTNITTNSLPLAMFAGIDPVSMGYEQIAAIMEVREYGPDMRWLMSRGVLQSNVAINDLKLNLVDFQSAFAPAPPAVGLGRVAAPFRAAGKLAEQVYQGSDNLAKIGAFKALKKQGMSNEDAADRVAAAFQNSRRIGKLYDITSNIPLVGAPFGRWSGDLVRILSTTFKNRPLTVVAYAVMLRALGTYLSRAYGENDAERELREGKGNYVPLPNWAGGNLPLSFKTGPESTTDLARYLLPFYAFGLNRADEDGMALTLYNKLGPLPYKPEKAYTPNPAGEKAVWAAQNTNDIALAPVVQLLLDADFTGKSIKDREANQRTGITATEGDQRLNQLRFAARSFLPGMGALVDDMVSAANGNPNYYGQRRDVPQTLLRFLGLKTEAFGKPEYEKALQLKQQAISGELGGEFKVRQELARLKAKGKLAPEEYQRRLDARAPIMQELLLKMQAAAELRRVYRAAPQ